MDNPDTDLIDWARFALVRNYADRRMPRLLGYFREDCERLLVACEQAVRHHRLVALIGLLEDLRRDSVQIGAWGLAQLAEAFENETRHIIDTGSRRFDQTPGLLALGAMIDRSLRLMEAEIRPSEGLQTFRLPIPPPGPLQSSPA